MEKVARIVALLPIGKIFDRIFKDGIAASAKEMGGEAIRIHPDFDSEGKLSAIRQSLETAEVVVADISARNPHVMYLAGLAEGIGRKTIFITQHGEEFPFDATSHPPIIYGSDAEFLKRELAARISGAASADPESRPDPRAQFLGTFGDLLKRHGYEHRGEIIMEGPNTYILKDQDMELALVQDLARRGREIGIRIKLM